MSDGAGRGLVERARDAAARNDWRQAFDLLMEADAGRPPGPHGPTGAWRGRVCGRPARCDHRGLGARAHTASMQAGDQVAAAAAAVRVAMHLLFDTGAHGTGAGLVGTSGAASGRSG